MSNQSDSSWPAWKVALAIGVPVALGGAGYYLYKKRSSEHHAESGDSQPQLSARKDPEGSSTPPVKPKLMEGPFKKATGLKNEGNASFKAGNYLEAVESYTKAIALCPKEKAQDLSTFHQNKAAAYEKLENWEGVVEECSEAIKLNPRYIKALFRRSRALETLGRKIECLEDITAVCIMERFQSSASMIFADRVLKDMGKEMANERYQNREPVMPSVLFVKQYFASFTEDVISQPLMDEERQNTNSGYIRARLALEKGDLEQVIPECTAEIDGGDDFSSPQKTQKTEANEPEIIPTTGYGTPRYVAAALVLRGTLLLLQGNCAAAKPDLERVINMKNADIKLRTNALIKRGSMYMQDQKSDEAQKDFDYAVEVDPDNTDVLHHRGQLHILLEKTDRALEDFERCMKLKPDFALARAQHCYTVYRQAFTNRNVVKTQAALAKFDELIESTPTCSESFGLYAQALTDQGDFNKANEMFERAIKAEPDNATQYVHQGLLLLQWKQDVAGSVELVQKAIDIDGKCDFAHETMGTIEVQRGNLQKASEHFEIAINLAKSEMEMAHLFSLKAAALAQVNLAAKYGIKSPTFSIA